jgi:hypothetical protein
MTAEEFANVVERTGLKPSKLSELLGKRSQTIRLYMCGKVPPPKLVVDKVLHLDRLINGESKTAVSVADPRYEELAKKIATAKAAGLPQLVARYQEELDSLN